MIFKRRDRRPVLKMLREFLWPRGGWVRAFEYVRHRLKRLPDTPQKIARGLAAGVFVSFTPLFGMHFLSAFIIARLMRGNVPAALLGTFFGNPLTYVPIAMTSLSFGHFLLGKQKPHRGVEHSLGDMFSGAFHDLMHNIKATFTSQNVDWTRLIIFYDDVFFPFLIGSLVPGVLTGLVAYYLSVPVIHAYQKRRRNRLRSKLNQLSKQSGKTTD